MRIFRILFFHELRALAIAAPTYVAAAVFLFLMGGLYLWALWDATQNPSPDPPVVTLFKLFPLPLLFIAPLLTMRSFAEEYRLGTLSALFSTPVRPAQVVLAKFAACYVFYMLLWGVALFFPLVAWWRLGGEFQDPRLLSQTALIGGYLFVGISGALYLAVGILASSVTRSTLVAALLTFAGLFVLVLAGRIIPQIPFSPGAWADLVQKPAEYLDTYRHLDIYLRGIADTRPLFFFGTGTLLSLGIATLAVESKT
jgi:ABC-2 type transport system permease protein